MTEKTASDYLKQAAKHIKKIYKKLGHSPNAKEYDKMAETQFKLRMLYKNNTTMNKLKEVAGIPKRAPGTETGSKAKSIREYIHCRACNCKIADKECVPGYKEEFCIGCPNIQKDNRKALPNIPEEIEQLTKYDGLQRSKFMNGNEVYLTDVDVIN